MEFISEELKPLVEQLAGNLSREFCGRRKPAFIGVVMHLAYAVAIFIAPVLSSYDGG